MENLQALFTGVELPFILLGSQIFFASFNKKAERDVFGARKRSGGNDPGDKIVIVKHTPKRGVEIWQVDAERKSGIRCSSKCRFLSREGLKAFSDGLQLALAAHGISSLSQWIDFEARTHVIRLDGGILQVEK